MTEMTDQKRRKNALIFGSFYLFYFILFCEAKYNFLISNIRGAWGHFACDNN